MLIQFNTTCQNNENRIAECRIWHREKNQQADLRCSSSMKTGIILDLLLGNILISHHPNLWTSSIALNSGYYTNRGTNHFIRWRKNSPSRDQIHTHNSLLQYQVKHTGANTQEKENNQPCSQSC